MICQTTKNTKTKYYCIISDDVPNDKKKNKNKKSKIILVMILNKNTIITVHVRPAINLPNCPSLTYKSLNIYGQTYIYISVMLSIIQKF